MTITIDGPLKGDARHAYAGTDDWVVVLSIDAGRFQHPFEVRVSCGEGARGLWRPSAWLKG